MTKEEIYDHMTSHYIYQHPYIECEFDDGKPCMELYSRVCDARVRIAERTGIDFEDRDLLEIVECMEEIAKICGLKMFDYGRRFGNLKST